MKNLAFLKFYFPNSLFFVFGSDNYLMAIGTIRALETDLLTEAEVEKVLAAKTFAEAFQVLKSIDFSQDSGEHKSPEEFEFVLQEGLYETKLLLTKLAQNGKALQILWLLYDLHNAKLLLKGKLLHNDPLVFQESILPFSGLSVEALQDLLQGNNNTEDKWIADAFQEAERQFTESKNPLQAEYILDNAFFGRIQMLAKRSNNSFVQKFVALSIDRTNILTAFRALLREDTNPVFLVGGSLDIVLLEQQSQQSFGHNFPWQWREAVTQGKEDFERTGNFSHFENILTAKVYETLIPTKFVIDGPDPLMAFFLRRQHNAQILRQILVGKRAGLSEEKIRHSLPQVF